MAKYGITESEIILALANSYTFLGDNIVLAAPTQSTRLYYFGLSAPTTNGAAVDVILQFGAGAPLYRFNLSPGQFIARHIGGGMRCIVGTEALIVNLSVAQTVYVSIEYETF